MNIEKLLRHTLAALLTVPVMSAAPAMALDGQIDEAQFIVGTDCSLSFMSDDSTDTAWVYFGGGDQYAGGDIWQGGNLIAGFFDPITGAGLESSCDLSNFFNQFQDGASGVSRAADDYIGLKFRADSGGSTYDYEIALSGVTNTVIINTRTLVGPPPNQAPTADAGTDQSVASAAAVTLTGVGSSDPENQVLSYSWSQTGGTVVVPTIHADGTLTSTAPTVAFDEAAQVLTFSLTVSDGVNSSTADTVQITVNPAVNQTPTADAGSDQAVASGASVTLNGSGSDPEAQTLSYFWLQTSGPAMTLTGSTTAQPTFTAPTLGWNAADVVMSFSLTVHDGVNASEYDTVQISVTAPVDVTHPTVTLAGMPATVMPGEVVSLSITFSEAVTGLATGDFSVANGLATTLSGSGASYTLSVTATGGGVLSVSLPADMTLDVADNGNLASNALTADPGAIGQTEERISQYLSDRANALVGAQPDLIRLLDPDSKTNVTASTMGFRLDTGGAQPVWASLHGQWGESAGSDTRYLLGALGAHLWLNDRTILGLMLEVDQMNEDDPLVSIKGTGWLIGPYLAGQVQDQPLFYETRLLWGKTDNDIAQTGWPSASFGSTRFLAQAKLKGEFDLGKAVAAPFLDASYVRDRSEAYVDGLNNPISAQDVQQSQVALGLDLTQAFAAHGGTLTPSGGLSAIYSDTNGSVGLTEPAFAGWRGRLELGLTFTRGLGQFEAQAFVDGLGTGDYSSYGLSLDYLIRF